MNEIVAAAKGFGGRGVGYSLMKRNLTALVCNLARRNPLAPVERARFDFRWVCPDRRHNPDNIAAAKKFILDGLVKAKVIRNDGWGEVAGFSDTWELGEPAGVEVTITPV